MMAGPQAEVSGAAAEGAPAEPENEATLDAVPDSPPSHLLAAVLPSGEATHDMLAALLECMPKSGCRAQCCKLSCLQCSQSHKSNVVIFSLQLDVITSLHLGHQLWYAVVSKSLA